MEQSVDNIAYIGNRGVTEMNMVVYYSLSMVYRFLRVPYIKIHEPPSISTIEKLMSNSAKEKAMDKTLIDVN